MPQPTRSQIHVNRPLTNISVAFVQSDLTFVARKIFKSVPVSKQSDLYYVFPRDQWFTDEMAVRAPASESAGSGYKVETDSYNCQVWALHQDIADQDRANQDEAIDLDQNATQFLTHKYLLRSERLFVQKYFSASLWTGSTSGGDITPTTKWDNASGNVVADVSAQMTAMQTKTGYRPNFMLVPQIVHDKIKENPDIKDRIKYVERVTGKSFSNQNMADLLGVENYVIAGATYNSAKEGATKSMSMILNSDNAALYYSAPNPGLKVPSAGYIFDWSGYIGAQGQQVSTMRAELLKADRVEIEAAFDMKQVASDLGVFFTDVLT